MSNLKFRKRPVVIEAIQWTGSNLREVITFMDGEPYTKSHYASDAWDLYCRLVAKEGLKINTLEGMMNANVGDWIIKGVKGEHYPCKPDVFAMTYEADAPPAAAHGDEAVRKDAERFDWLISNVCMGSVGFGDWWMNADEPASEWRAAIDAAMRAQAGEGGEM